MNLTDSVAILFARLDALARCFVGVDGGSILSGVQDAGLKARSCAFFQDQLNLTTFTADDPQDGRTVSLPRTMALGFIGAATSWVFGV
jgi:hypothetical protein